VQQEKLQLNPENNSKSDTSPFLNTSLDSINTQALKNVYGIDDIQWSLDVDQKKFWMPEQMVSISHLPVYKEMGNDLKKLFNQYNALGIAELFIFFEETSLAPSMEKALKKAKSEPLKQALKNFIDEEIKHSACFKRLLFKAAPNLYSESELKYNFVHISFVAKLMLDTLMLFPMLLPAWVWVAIFFEERTLMFSKEYIREKQKNPEHVDELFYQTHFYHMIDEVRHVKLDEHMIENFYRTFGKLHAKFVAWMVGRFIQRSAYPINMIKSCIGKIKLENPELLSKEIENKILDQSKQLIRTKSFLDLNFSDTAAPRTRSLMKHFSEFNDFWQKIMAPIR
jgi:hypothetical protein